MRSRSKTPVERVLQFCDLLNMIPIRVGQAAAWLLVPMVLLIAYDVIARRYLRHLDWIIDNDLHHIMNSSKIQDSEWHFSAALMFLSLGYAAAKNVQIRLDLFRDRFSARTRVAIELAGTVVLWIPYLTVATIYGYEYVQAAFLTNEQSSVLTGLPNRWIIKSTLAIGFTLTLLAALSFVLRATIWLWGPYEYRAHTRLEDISGDSEVADQDPSRSS
ncbi:MAG: TRAP transporter small permease subunit [Rhodospirillaceae bacterium]|jgi:TRAP-type mannitol/chloroaromatic compound transport system permease small subunit|nr:TRAP transporter small permease subunit [Rhodospirillaceae bacterium]MBT6140245.1 TRAP transporter small permease subunit [Rhodospirillaceae bacterium]